MAAAASSSSSSAAGTKTSLEIHKAVFNNDLTELERLLEANEHDLETQDLHGATAYMLALQLGHTRAAMMLLEAGACPRCRNAMGWEAHSVAALTGNTNLLRMSVVAMLKELDLAWERRLPKHLDRLRASPDFTLRLRWEARSWVPFITGLLPSDDITIYKRGTAVRVDSTLLGFSGLSWGRGSISFLVQGEEQGNPGAWFVMDNELRTAANARAALTNPPDHTIQDWVRKLMGSPLKRTKWNGAGVKVEEETVTSWLGFGETTTKREDSGGFSDCVCCKLTGLSMVEWKHAAVVRSGYSKEDWWLPAYEAASRRMSRRDRHPGIESEAGAGGDWPEDDGVSGPTASGEEAEAIAAAAYGGKGGPEKSMGKLHAVLETIKDGDVTSAQALATATTGDGEEDDSSASSSSSSTAAAATTMTAAASHPEVQEGIAPSVMASGRAKVLTAAEYFRGTSDGVVPPDVDDDHRRGTAAGIDIAALCGGVRIVPQTDKASLSSSGGGAGAGGADVARPMVGMYPELLSRESKDFSGKVLLAEGFPITKEDMLPLAEVMSLSGKHFASMKRFFETRLPDKGFPVSFSLPVFPTITASVQVVGIDLTAPAEELFRVPKDYAMGKYTERTAIRQL